MAALRVPETLPPERRHGGGLAHTGRAFRELLSDRRFAGYVLSCGLVFAAMFAYISGSPFVLQDIHGLSPQTFSLVFGLNAAGIMAMNGRERPHGRPPGPGPAAGRGPGRPGRRGATVLLVSVLAGVGLAGILPGLFLVVSSVGLVFPNATALALADHPDRAGSASALVGLSQYLFGAAAAPLVGIAGTGTAVPMAVVIAVCSAAAVVAYRVLAGRPAAGSPVKFRRRWLRVRRCSPPAQSPSPCPASCSRSPRPHRAVERQGAAGARHACARSWRYHDSGEWRPGHHPHDPRAKTFVRGWLASHRGSRTREARPSCSTSTTPRCRSTSARRHATSRPPWCAR